MLGLLVFGLASIGFSVNPPQVSAVQNATSYCRNSLPPRTSNSIIDACMRGYAAGVNSSPNSTCRTFSGAELSACTSAYNAGKNAVNSGGGGNPGGGGDGADGGPSGDGTGAESTPAPGPETINCGDEGVNCTDPAAKKTGTCDNNGCNLIGRYVNPAITVLSAIVVMAAIASLIFGGIQYSMSAGDPQKISEAKDRITKTLIAFIMYLFLFSFLQFLIPGGFLGIG